MSTLIACWIAAAVISTAVSLAVHGPLLLRGFLDEREWSQCGWSSEHYVAIFDLLSEQFEKSYISVEELNRLAKKAMENMSPDEVPRVTNTLLALGGDPSTFSRLLGEAMENMSPDEVSHMVDTMVDTLLAHERDLSTAPRLLDEAPINR